MLTTEERVDEGDYLEESGEAGGLMILPLVGADSAFEWLSIIGSIADINYMVFIRVSFL